MNMSSNNTSPWINIKLLFRSAHQQINHLRDRRLRKAAERNYRKTRTCSKISGSEPCVLADGMFDNPNHFFRLQLFLNAFNKIGTFCQLGVLRHRRERAARNTLEALGFNDFIFIEESDYLIDDFRAEAKRLLSGVNNHKDMLNLELPLGVPAYLFYDTVLKTQRHPQPATEDKVWEHHLAELLRNLALFQTVFNEHNIQAVVFSHCWKNEYAAAVWIALQHEVPVYHLTAYYETIRIRRIVNKFDYATPKERLSFETFQHLPAKLRRALIEAGWNYLRTRADGDTSDINGKRAYHPSARPATRHLAREALGIRDGRIIGIVYAHAWYDFPHIFGLGNFTDFLDWMEQTLEALSFKTDEAWFIKPHPLESWYGNFLIADLAVTLPSHIKILPEGIDSLAVTQAADVGITVHGTIGFEAAAYGLPMICADQSYYADWPFVYVAKSRSDYQALIDNASRIQPPNDEECDAAAAFAYLSCAAHPESLDMLKLRCDSMGRDLYYDIIDQYTAGDEVRIRETEAITNWIKSNSDSYSIFNKICYHSALPTQGYGQLPLNSDAES